MSDRAVYVHVGRKMRHEQSETSNVVFLRSKSKYITKTSIKSISISTEVLVVILAPNTSYTSLSSVLSSLIIKYNMAWRSKDN